MSDSSVGPGGSSTEGNGDAYEALCTQLAATELDRHLALFYWTAEEQRPVVSAYVGRGLERGERCLYIADENDPETVSGWLRAAGVDVEGRRDQGDLRLVHADEVYTDGGFDPAATVDELGARAEAAVEEGYEGLRVAGENTWSFRIESAVDDVVEFEARFEAECGDVPVTALCQYNATRFGDEAIGRALQGHEQIIYRGTLTENPYYVPPGDLLGTGGAKSNAELLLEQTRDVTRYRQDVRDREERLSVVNRVLRHNLRNELNVVLGRAEWLRTRCDLDGEALEQVQTIERVTRRLVDLAEEARHVERTLECVDHGSVPAAEAVARAVEAVERDGEFGLRVVDDLERPVAVDASFETALSELLDLAAAECSGAGGEPTLRLSGTAGSNTVTVALRNDSGVIPADSRWGVVGGIEDALEHSRGLQAWVVRWLVESVNGEIHLGEADDPDCVVVTVPVVDSPAGEP